MVDSQYHTNQVMLVGKSMSQRQKTEYMRTFQFPCAIDYNKYEKIKKIGQGTFGEVWKAKNKLTNEIVAMKKILMENEKQGFPMTAMREIRILKSVKNEHIVKMYDIVTHQVYRNNRVESVNYLIFEFCEHDLAGLLSDKNLKLRLADIKCLLKQLLLGLHYMHRNKMLHRDIKSSNVLVTKEGVLKLADFGLSRPFSDRRAEELTNRVVTLWYRPPELLLGDRLYSPKIDMWGAGCIMAEMWMRTPILQGATEQAQLVLIAKLCGTINTDVWPGVQRLPLFHKLVFEQGRTRKVIETVKPFIKLADACDLVDKLLVLDPTKRADTDAALDHDFFFNDPLPSSQEEIKETFSKINVSMLEYFSSRRPNVQHQQQQQQQQQQQHHRPGQPQHRQQQQHRPPLPRPPPQFQQQLPKYSSNMADANYLEPIF